MSHRKTCAACRYLHRRCGPDCFLAPYFPANQPKIFENVNRLFGVNNMIRMILEAPPQLRGEAARSIIFEANMRAHDPVGGCYALHCQLQSAIVDRMASLQQYQQQQGYGDTGPSQSPSENLGMDNATGDPLTLDLFPIVPMAQQQQQQDYGDTGPSRGSWQTPSTNLGRDNATGDPLTLDLFPIVPMTQQQQQQQFYNGNGLSQVSLQDSTRNPGMDISTSSPILRLHNFQQEQQHQSVAPHVYDPPIAAQQQQHQFYNGEGLPQVPFQASSRNPGKSIATSSPLMRDDFSIVPQHGQHQHQFWAPPDFCLSQAAWSMERSSNEYRSKQPICATSFSASLSCEGNATQSKECSGRFVAPTVPSNSLIVPQQLQQHQFVAPPDCGLQIAAQPQQHQFYNGDGLSRNPGMNIAASSPLMLHHFPEQQQQSLAPPVHNPQIAAQQQRQLYTDDGPSRASSQASSRNLGVNNATSSPSILHLPPQQRSYNRNGSHGT